METCFDNINSIRKALNSKKDCPSGNGYHPDNEREGTVMIGRDNNLYVIKVEKKSWKSLDIDFDNLNESFYVPVYFPVFEKIEKEDETGMEEKAGGSFPFFIKGEEWPTDTKRKIPMTFLCQFKDPRKPDSNLLYRLFYTVDQDDEFGSYADEYHVSSIELNETNIQKQIKLENTKTPVYKGYLIKQWRESKELIECETLFEKLKLFPDNDANNQLYELYSNSKYAPSANIKIGGTSVFCQYQTDKNRFNNFFQMSWCEEVPYPWGDAGIAHIIKDINPDDDNEELYLLWDCY